MLEQIAGIVWRRLDRPGRDECRLLKAPDGWRLEGAARYRSDEADCRLSYVIDSDAAWRSRSGRVSGSLGARGVEIRIRRAPSGEWSLDGRVVPGLDACADLDLGFTPATNLLPVRRCGLSVGEAVEAPAAWLDIDAGTIARLPQTYERRTELTYWYEAPSVGYAGLLEVTPVGFARRYPGLWEAESADASARDPL